jgi:hypothetical protein
VEEMEVFAAFFHVHDRTFYRKKDVVSSMPSVGHTWHGKRCEWPKSRPLKVA